MILDVVYNHLGPGSEAITAFGPYVTDRHETFWGDALDFREWGVREWAIQNACMWVEEYGIDGLRLDAVHAIYDDSPRHVLAELADRVHAGAPRALVISETSRRRRPADRGVGARRPLGGRAPPCAARAADRRAGRLLRAVRLGRGRRGRARPPPARAARRLRAGPRPDRQPRARRPPAARAAPRSPPRSSSSPRRRRSSSWARSTASPTRSSSSATTLDPRSPRPRGRAASRSSPPTRRSPARTCPTRRIRETFLRSKLSRRETPGMRDHYRRLLALRRRLPRDVRRADAMDRR